jgi:hypothetical protein
MSERTIKWVKVGEDWAIKSSEPLVRGSTVIVESRAGKGAVVEVGLELTDESYGQWHVYEVRRTVDDAY